MARPHRRCGWLSSRSTRQEILNSVRRGLGYNPTGSRAPAKRPSAREGRLVVNFLGMGPMELMVILVLALIIFGPGKLPEIAGQVGRVVRDFRRTTAELSSEFNRTLSLEIEDRKAAEAPAPPAPPAAYESYAAAPVAAVEPTEAPPVIAPPAMVMPETPVAAPVAVSAPVASKRRTIDEDLAPPY